METLYAHQVQDTATTTDGEGVPSPAVSDVRRPEVTLWESAGATMSPPAVSAERWAAGSTTWAASHAPPAAEIDDSRDTLSDGRGE